MNDTRHVVRNGIFCALVFLACYVVAWPVAQMGFVDDWSFIKIAQVFAATGQIHYTGWGTPMLGWMIPWGALFIRAFGFSFMVVKLSTLPVAVGTLLLFHSILRRFEIGPWNAVIGTLTLGLSPLFLPLSASFMTDIPGLFVIVLCLYLCQRALAAPTDKAAIGWLAAAALSNVVGGTARQVAWLGVLVMVPCTGLVLRKRVSVLVASIALWVMGVAGVLVLMRWFALQPYVVPTAIPPKIRYSSIELVAHSLLWADTFLSMLLCLLLLIAPVLLIWLPHFGKKRDHYVALVAGGVVPLVAGRVLLGELWLVWPPHLLFSELATKRDAGMAWFEELRRSLVPVPLQFAISIVLIAALLGCVFLLRERRLAPIPGVAVYSGQTMFWLLAPFSLAYLGLLILVIPDGSSFDRYMLGLMPFAVAASLWLYERVVGPRLPFISAVSLLFFSFFAVGATHNWFAWQRARLAAIHELRSAGVPRTEIQGGFEFDGWTQLEAGGKIDDSRIRIPAHWYKPRRPVAGISLGCENWFFPEVPAVVPKYSVGVMPFRCYLPSKFPSVYYTAWLPPFRRVVEVQRVPGA